METATESQALGKDLPCPVCNRLVLGEERYLKISEYQRGMKVSQFKVHFDCWHKQYNEATKTFFANMGRLAETFVFEIPSAIRQDGTIDEEKLKEIIGKANDVKAQMANIRPDNYTQEKKRGKK